jgi:hypothetical protein
VHEKVRKYYEERYAVKTSRILAVQCMLGIYSALCVSGCARTAESAQTVLVEKDAILIEKPDIKVVSSDPFSSRAALCLYRTASGSLILVRQWAVIHAVRLLSFDGMKIGDKAQLFLVPESAARSGIPFAIPQFERIAGPRAEEAYSSEDASVYIDVNLCPNP